MQSRWTRGAATKVPQVRDSSIGSTEEERYQEIFERQTLAYGARTMRPAEDALGRRSLMSPATSRRKTLFKN